MGIVCVVWFAQHHNTAVVAIEFGVIGRLSTCVLWNMLRCHQGVDARVTCSMSFFSSHTTYMTARSTLGGLCSWSLQTGRVSRTPLVVVPVTVNLFHTVSFKLSNESAVATDNIVSYERWAQVREVFDDDWIITWWSGPVFEQQFPHKPGIVRLIRQICFLYVAAAACCLWKAAGCDTWCDSRNAATLAALHHRLCCTGCAWILWGDQVEFGFEKKLDSE